MKEWLYNNFTISPNLPPSAEVNLSDVESGTIWKCFPKAIRLTYVSDWDCPEETDYWYVIKDTPFDLAALKAKRRYEITKGNRNFRVELISPDDCAELMYDVYVESLSGYKNSPQPKSIESFKSSIYPWSHYDETIGGGRVMLVYGAFDEDNRLCGYAHLIKYKDHCSFSTLKTRPSSESLGINAAICNKILMDLDRDLSNGGFYISDGSRNLFHETHFQDYLHKYFGFRRAFCRLNVIYPKWMHIVMRIWFPFRKVFYKMDRISIFHALNALLKSEEISRKCKK